MPAPAAAPTRVRWFGVGRSAASDSRAAGLSAAHEALQGDEPKLLVVFSSEAHDLEQLLAGIAEVAAGVPMIGCSTSGEIATDGPGEAGVVVVAIGGPGYSCTTASSTEVSGRLREAGAAVGACIAEVDRPHRVLLLLTDGLAGDQQEVVRGAYRVVGAAVPLVGGCAGDDLAMQLTHQFHDGRLLANAVVAAAIGSDTPMGIGIRHGWRKVGEPMLVTRSAGNRVHSLDDQPALDVYLDRLGAPASVRDDAAAFTRYAMTHPLGLSRRSGEEVRFIAEADFRDRSLGCIAAVAEGGLVWIMEGDRESVLDATDAACSDALAAIGGARPVGVLAFDCVARRGVLGDEGIHDEVRRIGEQVGGAPVAGFYTYGEIARTRGTTGFHNQTLVVLALT